LRWGHRRVKKALFPTSLTHRNKSDISFPVLEKAWQRPLPLNSLNVILSKLFFGVISHQWAFETASAACRAGLQLCMQF
jgi:hypothetical protein